MPQSKTEVKNGIEDEDVSVLLTLPLSEALSLCAIAT